jgi:protein arginine kinase
MRLTDLVQQPGEWLRGTGADSDIVISSRIRLARNIAGYPFVTRLQPDQQAELAHTLSENLIAGDLIPDAHYFGLKGARDIERRLLVERHLISKEHEDAELERGVVIQATEAVSIMINEEDHLRIQGLRSGFELDEAWATLNAVDTGLGESVPYAYSERLGFLTACPTNVGTGLRASVMLHLPALEMAKQIEKVFHAVAKINLAVRGLYGEGTQASGNFYQISNQITLGKTEEEIITETKAVIPEIVENERKARDFLVTRNRQQIEDRVWRAYGMLRSARIISSGETIALLSHLRLGVHLGVLPGLDIGAVNQLFVRTLPAHLQILEGRELEPQTRDVARAAYIRKCLGEI